MSRSFCSLEGWGRPESFFTTNSSFLVHNDTITPLTILEGAGTVTQPLSDEESVDSNLALPLGLYHTGSQSSTDSASLSNR